MNKTLVLAVTSLVVSAGLSMAACQSSSSDGTTPTTTGPGAGGDSSAGGENSTGGTTGGTSSDAGTGGIATGGTPGTGGTGGTSDTGGVSAAGGDATGGTANGGASVGGAATGGAGGAVSCKEDKLHPGKAGMPSLYCPFAVASGGAGGTSTAVYCDAPTEHCCETAANTVPASCQPAATACPTSATDWGCFDANTDCASGQVCCVFGMEAVVNNIDTTCMSMFPTNHFLGGKVSGSKCEATCQAGMELQVCEADTDCTAPQTCQPTTSKGAQFGVCGTM